MSTLLGILLLGLHAGSSQPIPRTPGSLQVNTTHGVVLGRVMNGSRAWLGIPYAEPPVNQLRFELPVPRTAWPGVRPAMVWPKSCWNVAAPTNESRTLFDEDCLYLNVFSPLEPSSQLRPVLLWIHGGCYLGGSTSIYPGFNLSAVTDSVVVSIQYRLNFLSWLAFDDQIDKGAVNLGFWDQNMAMDWVHQNIRAFGGDPTRVLLFGQSAGGGSVAAHLLMPQSAGLFSSAILESPDTQSVRGVCTYKLRQDAVQRTKMFAAMVGCGSDAGNLVACLRSLPVEAVVAGRGMALSGYFGPVVDGSMFPALPIDLFGKGQFNKEVPLMVGSSACEVCMDVAKFWGPPGEKNLTGLVYQERMSLLFQHHSHAVIQEYSLAQSHLGYWEVMAQAKSDHDYACPHHVLASTLVKAGATVWRFLFTHVTEDWDRRYYGAAHAGEIPYVFSSPDQVLGSFLGYKSFNNKEWELSQQMAVAWRSMAANGNPNHPGLGVYWEPMELEPGRSGLGQEPPQPVLVFDVPVRVAVTGIPTTEHCDRLWDDLPPDMNCPFCY